jgi:arylsulfatase A-like enzyme
MTDDQGYGDLSAHGNTEIHTPHIDALHEESVRLTNFHVSPTCSPTRSALLTGRFNMRVGVWHTIRGRCLLRADETTLGNIFAANGYHTGLFGKWHLGESFPFRPNDRGFQETVWHGCGAPGQTSDYWGNDYYDDIYWRNNVPEQFEGYCTDIWFDEALDFIERKKDEPFFCYIPTNAPHEPFLVDEEYRKPYADAGIEEPRATFYGMIAKVDENVGRLTARLDELGLSENTILIFMTDNGSVAGYRDGKGFNAGMRGVKGSPYDGGHRVPFFVRWPAGGLAHGVDFNQISAHIDVAPTLIDFCGLDYSPEKPFDGISLAPLLRGSPPADWDRTLFAGTQRVDMPVKWRNTALMTQRWRLLRGEELFDMAQDPGQQHDVAAAHPDVVRKLNADHDAWWSSVSERFDVPARVVIGAKQANPTDINCHDLRIDGSGRFPWKQHLMREGVAATGYWSIDVARPGTYRFTLRRWPKHLRTPISGAIQDGTALNITQARIRVGEEDQSIPVTPEMVGAAFELELDAGPTEMQTWFDQENGETGNAYFVEVERVTQHAS